MREVAFIKQNKEKWLGIEHVISGKLKKNPDELSSLYINLVNDLSFAKTYYPKSKTTVYLNHLSTLIFQKIYKTKRVEENRFLYFFKTEVPLLVYQYRKYLFFAFSLFTIFFSVGLVSARYDIDFVKMIIGEEYLNMTIENIKNGNPVAVYGQGSTWGEALFIIENNLKVGLNLYIFGIFAGVGSIYILFKNSVDISALLFFLSKYGALSNFSRGLWLHGVFEIFSMVIETMAGLVLGASILFPKTFSRINSFKRGFKDSFKIFLSTVPFTIFAGILEGYVTRYALKMNLGINLFIIFGTLFIISYYYIYYPFIVNKKLRNHHSI